MQPRLPIPELAHPAASALRHRAAELRRFAAAIEHAGVFGLDAPDPPHDDDDEDAPARAALCRRMLAHNLQQLLRCADDLRDTAWRYELRAAHLDARPLGSGQVA